jgi:archaellum biogenesis ATPase FlaH
MGNETDIWFLKVLVNEKKVRRTNVIILIDSFSKAGITKNQK